ncbi:hypothetical protein [Streptomyces sp. NPDC096153]|uniref:hypothetical protein n=1 Tax=Streptomyces sp. NPDC096153 TaxID=3155548 RepID=UPI003322945E
MTVPLLPPITYSLAVFDGDALTEGPRFIRTRGMSRWHRPRNGVAYANGRTVYGAWCGYGIGGSERAGEYASSDTLPPGEPVCATCDGRAVGAGQDTGPDGRRLLYTPRTLRPPKSCPGSRKRLFEELPGGRAGRCLVCSDVHPLRAMGGPYDSRYAIVQHPPGAGLIGTCPFHAWRYPTAVDGRVACSCGRPMPDPNSAKDTTP